MILSQAFRRIPFVAGDLLDWPAAAYPDRPALECEPGVISFRELLERVVERQRILGSFGVARFERWGLLSDNSADFFISLFALLRLGAVVAPISHATNPAGLEVTAAEARLTGILLRSGSFAADPLLLPRRATRLAGNLDVFLLDDSLRRHKPLGLPVDVDPALILWTSGSGGPPKGAVFQHFALLGNIRSNICALGLQDDDRTLVLLPLSHAYALVHQCLCHLAIGATVCLVKGPVLPAALCRHMEEARITTLAVVPPLLRVLLEGV